jgi:Spy/CpxP family protein refolding chaperone
VKSGWLTAALLLSLGVNIGLVGVGIARRHAFERYLDRPRLERPVERMAERMSGRMGGRFERPGEMLADRLDLEGDAREKFLAAHRRIAERTRQARDRIDDLRRELREQVLAPEPDRARVEALLGEIAAQEAEITRAFVEGLLDARAPLDARQLRRYLELLQRFGPPGPGGGPGDRGPDGGRRRFAPHRPDAPTVPDEPDRP